MTLEEALIELDTFANDERLSEDARTACHIGGEALREKMWEHRKEIKSELEVAIKEKIDVAYDEVASKYTIVSSGIRISDDMKIDDYVDSIAGILATLMSDDIKGDD